MVDMVKSDSSEIGVIYSKPAFYTDKIYTSFDIQNKIVRLTFCESWQGTPQMSAIAAVMLTEGGVMSLVQLLNDIQQKFKTENTTETLQ